MKAVRIAVFALLAAGAAAALPGRAHAQALRGRLLDDVTGNPVGAAVVELVDDAGERVDAFLTRDDGTFDLRAPDRGAFRVRVERLGYRSLVLGPFDVPAEGAARHDLRVPPAPVQLRGITAEGAPRCVVNPATGERTALLWGEARKVLAAAALVQDRELVRYEAVRFRRTLDPSRSVLYSEATRVGVLSRPFHAPPAEELVRRGFVQVENDSTVYYVPDPSVALSPAFLDSHCFHIATRRGPEGRFVGLSFEPLRGRRVPDVAGTLWLREEDAALASLEFEYRGLAQGAWDRASGGRAEFERLANGLWVIRRWALRMPVIEESSRFLGLGTRLDLVAVTEEGGELLAAYGTDGVLLTRTPPDRVTGFVRDSISGGPLAGATVHLSGTLESTTSGADGSFEFLDLPPGEYVASFHHALIDTLGIFPPVRVFQVPREEPVPLGLPSAATVLGMACPDLRPGVSTGVLSGRVLDAAGGPVQGAEVVVVFDHAAHRTTADVETDADGWYRVCGLPAGVTVRVRANDGAVSGAATVPPHGFARLDLVAPGVGGGLRLGGRQIGREGRLDAAAPDARPPGPGSPPGPAAACPGTGRPPTRASSSGAP